MAGDVSSVPGVLGFQSQIASVMEVFANAAVAEICKIMELSYSELHCELLKSQREKNELHTEILKNHRENHLLKRRLKMMEMRESFYRKANKLRECATESGRVRVRISSVQTSQCSTDEPVQDTVTHQTHQQCVMQSLEQDGESDVLVLKREQSESINKERDGEVTANQGRENTLQQNPAAHHQHQCDEEPDFLKEEDTEEHKDTPTHNGSCSDEAAPCVDPERDVPVSETSWVGGMFNSYPGAEASAGACVDDYFMQRDGACAYGPEMGTGAPAFPDGALPQAEEQPVPPFKADHHMACKFCGKQFPHTSALVLHQRVHTGEKPYYCALCGKRFGQASSLRKHYGVHRGEKPFSCAHCGKHFSDQSNLKKHVNVHTGVKPYACTQCGKTFNQSSNLKTHMKIHTREKPFSCQRCGHIFAYKSSLVKHQQRNCLLQNPLGPF